MSVVNGRTNKPKIIDAESFVPFVSQNHLGRKSSLRSSSPTFTVFSVKSLKDVFVLKNVHPSKMMIY